MNIEKTKSKKNGKYFGHFEKKEEAQEFLDHWINRYKHTPNPEKTSASRLCREAQERGINLYVNTFLTELRRRNITIRNHKPKEKKKVRKTFTISKKAEEVLDNYPNKSYIVDLGVRLTLGIPTEDIVIFFPTDEDEENCNVIFEHTKKGNIEATISGGLDRKFEQQIRMLLKRAKDQDSSVIIKYAETNGYKYIGGTKILRK